MPVASVTLMRGVSTPRGGVECAQSLQVRRMREDAAGIVLEPVPLREEIVAAVVADFIDAAVRARG